LPAKPNNLQAPDGIQMAIPDTSCPVLSSIYGSGFCQLTGQIPPVLFTSCTPYSPLFLKITASPEKTNYFWGLKA
jgi:hypothetical protein